LAIPARPLPQFLNPPPATTPGLPGTPTVPGLPAAPATPGQPLNFLQWLQGFTSGSIKGGPKPRFDQAARKAVSGMFAQPAGTNQFPLLSQLQSGQQPFAGLQGLLARIPR
jgi:hypothetical protein